MNFIDKDVTRFFSYTTLKLQYIGLELIIGTKSSHWDMV